MESIFLQTFAVFSLVVLLPQLCSADKYLFVLGLETHQGSHMISMTTAAKAMIERQHNVTLVLPSGRDEVIRKALHNLTYVSDIHQTSIPADLERERANMMKWSQLVLNGSYYDIIKYGTGPSRQIRTFCEDVLSDVRLLQRLRDSQFDLVFVNGIFPCSVLIAQHLGIPFVTFLPVIPPSGALRLFCQPVNPAYNPELFTGHADRMSFQQRVKNTLYSLFHWQLIKLTYRYLDDLKEKFDIKPEVSILDTLSQTELWFIYGDFVLDFPRAYQPNVVSVGGLTARPAELLSEDLEDFMQSSGNEGAIILSLGTYVVAMDTEIADVFAEAFGDLPQKVIWKSAGQPPSSLPTNVKILPWLPQNDILGHSKIRLMISQCGINGVFEAIYHAVPIICIPIQSDQWDNAKRVQIKGVAVQLERKSLTKEALVHAVNTVLGDDSFQTNMSRLSSLFHDTELPAPQRLVHWIEKVVRHGGASHLGTAAFDLNTIQYNLIDVFAFLGVVLMVL